MKISYPLLEDIFPKLFEQEALLVVVAALVDYY